MVKKNQDQLDWEEYQKSLQDQKDWEEYQSELAKKDEELTLGDKTFDTVTGAAQTVGKVVDYPFGILRGIVNSAQKGSLQPALGAIGGNAPSSTEVMKTLGVPDEPLATIPQMQVSKHRSIGPFNPSLADAAGVLADVASGPAQLKAIKSVIPSGLSSQLTLSAIGQGKNAGKIGLEAELEASRKGINPENVNKTNVALSNYALDNNIVSAFSTPRKIAQKAYNNMKDAGDKLSEMISNAQESIVKNGAASSYSLSDLTNDTVKKIQEAPLGLAMSGQNTVKNVVDYIQGHLTENIGDLPSLKDWQRLKESLDNEVNWNKRGDLPVNEETAKIMRSLVNNEIENQISMAEKYIGEGFKPEFLKQKQVYGMSKRIYEPALTKSLELDKLPVSHSTIGAAESAVGIPSFLSKTASVGKTAMAKGIRAGEKSMPAISPYLEKTLMVRPYISPINKREK